MLGQVEFILIGMASSLLPLLGHYTYTKRIFWPTFLIWGLLGTARFVEVDQKTFIVASWVLGAYTIGLCYRRYVCKDR